MNSRDDQYKLRTQGRDWGGEMREELDTQCGFAIAVCVLDVFSGLVREF